MKMCFITLCCLIRRRYDGCKKIALVAQEGMKNKNQLKKLIEDHKTFILNNFIVSTEGTAEYFRNNMKIIANDVVYSGKEGGT